MKKTVALILSCCLCLSLFGCSTYSQSYAAAQALMDSGDVIGAEAAFKQLGDYKDSPEKVKECRYLTAQALMQSGEYLSAINDLDGLGEYKDTAALITECRYLYAVQLAEDGSLEEAAAAFGELNSYKDAAERKTGCENELTYRSAVSALDAGRNAEGLEELNNAMLLFNGLGSYKDSSLCLQESCYLAAQRISGRSDISLSDCQLSAELYARSGDLREDGPEAMRRMNRLSLWIYVRENGLDETDTEGVSCRKLMLLDKSTTDNSGIVTQEKLTLYAYEAQTLVLAREQVYASGGVTYTETLRLMLDISVPETASVQASSYIDLGIYSSYISEIYRGVSDIGSLKTKADIATVGYVQQARQVSGKNMQTTDMKDQISIEKILNSIPEFMSGFDGQFALLPFSLSLQAMGFGITDAPPVRTEDFAAAELPGWAQGVEPELYVPDDSEKFKTEQPVLAISVSGAAIRKGPGTTYDIVDTATLGESMMTSALSNGWLYVRYDKREYGWIDMSQLFGSWMFETGINPALQGFTAPKKYAAKLTVISTTDKANARSGPDREATMLGSYIAGTPGVLIGTTDVWYFINFDGEYGWVHKNNFTKNIH